MILTPLIDIDNLNPTSILSIFRTFVVIDDKGERNKDTRGRETKTLVHGEKNKDISVLR